MEFPSLSSCLTLYQNTVMSGTIEDITIFFISAGWLQHMDSVHSFTVPVTSAPELSSSSNINVNGRRSFHVDGSPLCKPMQPEAQA